MSVLDLARPELLALQPYSSARMEASGGTVWLNANELPWAQAQSPELALNRYPEPQPPALIERLAELYGVASDQVFVGRGSDEAIDLLTRAFCAAGASNVIISPPTFGMYAVAARVQGAAVREVPLRADRDYALDVEALLAAVSRQTRLVYVCTPNNPTGNVVPAAVLLRLAEALRGRAVLVIDEAYVEFADADSASSLLAQYDHVVVLRTLSKAYGLAGARVGVALARAEVIQLLRRIMPPYPLPSASIAAALGVLHSEARRAGAERLRLICQQRAQLRPALAALPGVIDVLPSQANFLVVRFVDAAAVYARLVAAGVIVRSLHKYPGLHDGLRISIGTPEENAVLLSTLDSAQRAA